MRAYPAGRGSEKASRDPFNAYFLPSQSRHREVAALIPSSAIHVASTRTRLKVHTVCCRIHRKRQRLPSNGSIESDAASAYLHTRTKSRRVTSDRVLAFTNSDAGPVRVGAMTAAHPHRCLAAWRAAMGASDDNQRQT